MFFVGNLCTKISLYILTWQKMWIRCIIHSLSLVPGSLALRVWAGALLTRDWASFSILGASKLICHLALLRVGINLSPYALFGEFRGLTPLMGYNSSRIFLLNACAVSPATFTGDDTEYKSLFSQSFFSTDWIKVNRNGFPLVVKKGFTYRWDWWACESLFKHGIHNSSYPRPVAVYTVVIVRQVSNKLKFYSSVISKKTTR